MLLRSRAASLPGGPAFAAAPFFKTRVMGLAEPLVKLGFFLLGCVAEVLPLNQFNFATSTHRFSHLSKMCAHTVACRLQPGTEGDADAPRRLQHIVMYASVGASAFADIARFSYPAAIPASVPSLFLACAFLSQALILAFHLQGNELDIALHTLLMLASAALGVASLASGIMPDSLAACLARCGSMLTLGSFWVQSGDLIFNTQRAAFRSSDGVATVPALFCLHVAGWSLLLLACMVAVQPRRCDAKLHARGGAAAGA